jgi:16S rRNA (cytidine1402-2'-O)-methyltransferase
VSYHEHNERDRAPELCVALEAGKNIGLVSDAGTPLISDPGFRLTKLAIDKGIKVVPIPGVAAFVAGLTASGLPSDRFMFAGFLPARSAARRSRLEELRTVAATLILYEAPHRVASTIRDALEVLGDRDAVIARELTKLHEEFKRGKLSELVGVFTLSSPARGEIVLLVAGASADGGSQEQPSSLPQAFSKRMQELEREGADEKAALKTAAKELGLKRDEAYRLLLSQKNRRSR